MKILKTLMMATALLLVSVAITSCGSDASAQEEQGKEYTSAYICPMHCDGSGSEAPGQCPVCKMDYVQKDAAKEMKENHDGHDHDSHDGHDHGSHDGHDHGSHDGHDHGSHEGHAH